MLHRYQCVCILCMLARAASAADRSVYAYKCASAYVLAYQSVMLFDTASTHGAWYSKHHVMLAELYPKRHYHQSKLTLVCSVCCTVYAYVCCCALYCWSSYDEHCDAAA
jgi:hypothetical protein